MKSIKDGMPWQQQAAASHLPQTGPFIYKWNNRSYFCSFVYFMENVSVQINTWRSTSFDRKMLIN